jgi:transcriptional regulator with XRE-family HTH domain
MVEIMNGEELKSLRTKYNLSQAELAAKLGYYSAGEPNRSVISRWENDKVRIGKRAELALTGIFYNCESNRGY